MKKKFLIVLAIILIIALCISLWFYAYHRHKSNDNLPSLSKISKMDEAAANSILIGYNIQQLREVWGEPDYCNENEDIWLIEATRLIVNYKNDGEVAICALEDSKPLYYVG